MAKNLNKKRKTWLPIHKENWFGDWFDPHESYLRLPSFWWPFTIIIIGVALVSWKVIHDQDLVWGLDSRVEQWYEWFKIPLWVLALLIPVLGLFNANHKSEQARASMELTKAQNNFANYYKHLQEFESYMKANPTSYKYLKNVNHRLLHSVIYEKCEVGNYSPKTEILELALKQNLKILEGVKVYIERRDAGDFYYELLIDVDLNITSTRIKLRNSVEIESTFIPNSISLDCRHGVSGKASYVKLAKGKVSDTIEIIIEIYSLIEYSFGFSPGLSGSLYSSIQLLRHIKSVSPNLTDLNPIGSQIDKNNLDGFVTFYAVDVCEECERLKQNCIILQG